MSFPLCALASLFSLFTVLCTRLMLQTHRVKNLQAAHGTSDDGSYDA